MLELTILIPVIGAKNVEDTIRSILNQHSLPACEIIVLHNGVSIDEVSVLKQKYAIMPQSIIREIYIHTVGKGRALNIGISEAAYDIIAVIDADCILEEQAIYKALCRFEDSDIAAVGCKIKVLRKTSSMLERLQYYEYIKAFNITRPLLNRFKCDCIISGAFGLFRRSSLLSIGNYDISTVGEDMEIVLRLQKLKRPQDKIVYAPDAVAYTEVPSTFSGVLCQRERWQRGLLDSIIKNNSMILNPFYGLMGVIIVPYQVLFELIEPFFVVIGISDLTGITKILYNHTQRKFILFGVVLNLVIDYFITIAALYIERRGNSPMKLCDWFETAVMVVLCMLMTILICFARIIGILTFPWRRNVWNGNRIC